ncbi:hypothetical protein DL766_010198 [Monosporascus sp. MC13-8B]|nr:hypothetical protein DL766_010198 [Monosporascus sp. MC13-8B]
MLKSLLPSLLLFAGSSLDVALAAVASVRRDGPIPALPSDPNTTKYCTWWIDLDTAMPCSTLLTDNFITLADFRRWNPSITEDCRNLEVGHSYCVEAMSEPPPATTTTLTSSSTSTTTTTTALPSTTKPPNGIETPTPTQPVIDDNCDKFHFVKAGETCDTIAKANGITQAQFLAWNPSAGKQCDGLWAEAYACVSVISHEPTPTDPGNGVETPQPIQSGMVGNCNTFHFVEKGQTCQVIAGLYSINVSQFTTWNPAVGKDCSSLWSDTYACVGLIGSTKPPPPTSTKTGNGISTPTPIQPSMVNNCDKFYFVNSGDTCASIVSKSGISVAQFVQWNPSVGKDCSGLWAKVYTCISIIGHTPTPTDPGNGIKTPTPIQDGMTRNCKAFHLVKKGDTYASIAAKYKISVTQFTKWNPAVGASCTSLWLDTYACVAVL